jgi:L-asparaginase II
MNPVLVNIKRGEVVESFHRGVICVVNEQGQVIFSEGNINQLCYPRSAMKYFQHLPLLLSPNFDKLNLSQEDIAIMCASHNGEDTHLQAAAKILEKIDMHESDLQCGSQEPNLRKDRIKLYNQNLMPTALHNNCSGKHAGFLAYCKAQNLPTADYLNPEHQLHQDMKEIVAKFYQCDPRDMKVGMDGCSAPIFSATVLQQALGFKNLSTPEQIGDQNLVNACQIMLEAIAHNPYLIAGNKRYCTSLMQVTQGRIIGKTGADGVYSAVIPQYKIGISVKIDDGTMGPQYTVMQALLSQMGLLSIEEQTELDDYHHHTTKNWNKNITGKVVPSSEWHAPNLFE